MKYPAYRNVSWRGGTPGPERSISKLFVERTKQRINEFALVWYGPRAALTEASGHGLDPNCCDLAAMRLKKVPRRFSGLIAEWLLPKAIELLQLMMHLAAQSSAVAGRAL